MTYLEDSREAYKEWVSDSKYILLQRYNKRDNSSSVYAVLCSKRGNATYKRRVMARFGDLSRKLRSLYFFNPLSKFSEYTPALWLTLTYDTKRCGLREAWEKIGKEFNVFRTKLQNHYGKIHIIRIFEATLNGYPHIHAIVIFENKIFETVNQYSRKRNRFVWIVHEKNKIATFWHSFIDVQAVHSLGSPMRYLGKYLTKTIDAKKASIPVLNTLAMTWIHRKRSFALSSEFIKALHNSKPYKKTIAQVDLFGNNVDDIQLICYGVVPRELLGIDSDESIIKLDPDVAQKAINYALDRRKY